MKMTKKMGTKGVMGTFQNEFYGVLIFSIIATVLMIHLDAFERLYLFAHNLGRFEIGDFAVFFPAFLAIGFTCFSYRRIKELETEISTRSRLEQKLRESEKKFKNLSITDELTQLYNSRYFYHTLETEIERTIRYDRPLSVVLLDVDNFKNFNDKYGHLAGDKVLKELGKMMKECIRKTDTAHRYGGEEFTLILPETSGTNALTVAERIRKQFEAQTFSPKPGDTATCTVSIGIGQYGPMEEMQAFLERVYKAMYAAKKQGKNRISLSKPVGRSQTVSSDAEFRGSNPIGSQMIGRSIALQE